MLLTGKGRIPDKELASSGEATFAIDRFPCNLFIPKAISQISWWILKLPFYLPFKATDTNPPPTPLSAQRNPGSQPFSKHQPPEQDHRRA
jgi:hypothetical protein